jgi:hypothetical protein
MDWLKTLAPLLGTALAGPLGGAAASFIADKLGVKEATIEAVTDVLNSGKMSADQIASLKLAEIEFEKFLKQNAIDLEKIHAGDRDSARKLQTTTQSNIPGFLAVGVTFGFFGILLFLLLEGVPATGGDALLVMLGALGAAWGSVISFYFGSSSGSAAKTEALSNLARK